MTPIGHLIIGSLGWSLMFILAVAIFGGDEDRFGPGYPQRFTFLLVLAVLLILYGCGMP